MQQFTIEHRLPKKGETYIARDEEGVRLDVATGDWNTTDVDVIVPVAPTWPDAEVIRIKEGERNTQTLSEEILAVREPGGGYVDAEGNVWIDGVDAITAWEPYQPGVRTVSSAEDLRTLPRDSVVRDVDGDAWQKRPNDTWSCASPAAVGQYTSGDFYTHYSPLTVVYTPREDVYDEAPAPEPEPGPGPEQPTADVIRITGIDPGYQHGYDVPVIAIRQDSDYQDDTCWYRTRRGFRIDPELITAWDDIDTGDGGDK